MKALADFEKILAVGVQGPAVGLGVAMLPLFDVIIASDKANFCIPCGKFGLVPEGLSVLSESIGIVAVSAKA